RQRLTDARCSWRNRNQRRSPETRRTGISMIRLYRPFYGKKINEQDFVAMATHEVARLTDLEPAPLGFILPSVTIGAQMTERDEFLIQVRRDLDEWHRWLRSIFFTGG